MRPSKGSKSLGRTPGDERRASAFPLGAHGEESEASMAAPAGLALVATAAAAASAAAALPEALPRGTYLALGGSNTCGHGIGSRESSFQSIVAQAFDHHVDRCVAAMGPVFSAACIDSFIPANTSFATVEFLPNMLGNERVQLSGFGVILRALASRGIPAVVVQLLPYWPPARKNYDHLHGRMVAMCNAVGMPWALFNASALRMASGPSLSSNATRVFLEDDKHLSAAGHQAVARVVMGLLPRAIASAPQARHLDSDAALMASGPLPVACHLGDQLGSIIEASRGFSRVDIGGFGGATGKIGWEAREPGAELVLCAHSAPNFPDSVVHVGFQKSHRHNLPLMGYAHVGCEPCTCDLIFAGTKPDRYCAPTNCSFDGLHLKRRDRTTVTDFSVLRVRPAVPTKVHNGTCPCRLHVSNPTNPSTRHRIVVRALVEGSRRDTKFANIWHFSFASGREAAG